MNNNSLTYHGVVTIDVVTRNGITIKRKTLNNGTDKLFLMFAKAVSNADFSDLLPRYIDIVDSQNKSLTNNIIPNITYDESKNVDGNYVPYGVPFARVSATILHNMIGSGAPDRLVLKSNSNDTLAFVSLGDDIKTSLNNLSNGTQFIVVWDLYITNKEG